MSVDTMWTLNTHATWNFFLQVMLSFCHFVIMCWILSTTGVITQEYFLGVNWLIVIHFPFSTFLILLEIKKKLKCSFKKMPECGYFSWTRSDYLRVISLKGSDTESFLIYFDFYVYICSIFPIIGRYIFRICHVYNTILVCEGKGWLFMFF